MSAATAIATTCAPHGTPAAGEDPWARWRLLDEGVNLAFLQRDGQALARCAADLSTGTEPWSIYYRALALFYLGALPGAPAPVVLGHAAQALEIADAMPPSSAEMTVERLVLSGCISGLLASLTRGWKRAMAGKRALTDLGGAVRLGHDNPRAVFAEASASYAISPPHGRDSFEAWDRLLRCEKLFERAASRPTGPAWGHVQLLLYLGRGHLRRGEVVLAQQVVARLQRLPKARSLAAVLEFVASVERA